MLQLVNVKGFLVIFVVFLQLFKIRVGIFQNKKLRGKRRMSKEISKNIWFQLNFIESFCIFLEKVTFLS